MMGDKETLSMVAEMRGFDIPVIKLTGDRIGGNNASCIGVGIDNIAGVQVMYLSLQHEDGTALIALLNGRQFDELVRLINGRADMLNAGAGSTMDTAQ
jgi:hypothetical protein